MGLDFEFNVCQISYLQTFTMFVNKAPWHFEVKINPRNPKTNELKNVILRWLQAEKMRFKSQCHWNEFAIYLLQLS